MIDVLQGYLRLLQEHPRAEKLMREVLTADFTTGFVGGFVWSGLEGLRDFLAQRDGFFDEVHTIEELIERGEDENGDLVARARLRFFLAQDLDQKSPPVHGSAESAKTILATIQQSPPPAAKPTLSAPIINISLRASRTPQRAITRPLTLRAGHTLRATPASDHPAQLRFHGATRIRNTQAPVALSAESHAGPDDRIRPRARSPPSLGFGDVRSFGSGCWRHLHCDANGVLGTSVVCSTCRFSAMPLGSCQQCPFRVSSGRRAGPGFAPSRGVAVLPTPPAAGVPPIRRRPSGPSP